MSCRRDRCHPTADRDHDDRRPQLPPPRPAAGPLVPGPPPERTDDRPGDRRRRQGAQRRPLRGAHPRPPPAVPARREPDGVHVRRHRAGDCGEAVAPAVPPVRARRAGGHLPRSGHRAVRPDRRPRPAGPQARHRAHTAPAGPGARRRVPARRPHAGAVGGVQPRVRRRRTDEPRVPRPLGGALPDQLHRAPTTRASSSISVGSTPASSRSATTSSTIPGATSPTGTSTPARSQKDRRVCGPAVGHCASSTTAASTIASPTC